MSSFDNMVATYRAAGLTEEAARVAAVGRDYRSEAEARAAWDRHDQLVEAERSAALAMLNPQVPAPALASETLAVIEAAQTKLGMTRTAAREYALGLQNRETRRNGAGHAKTFMREFASSLNRSAAA
ncbi:hypothetical protein GCM10009827_083840 [Dactylosporangium maewongense]|uniref:Uncharacterized protein n=1 Tax=Dactylosporangium maewongense TaxID=634393 RepID=A0ABN2C110_9ACTN